MARIATRNISYRTNFIFLYQRGAQSDLIRITLTVHNHRLGGPGRFIAHVEYLIPRPQVLLAIPMTIQAPLHLQRLSLIHQGHLIDRTVTSVAANSLGHVNAVIEKDKVRKLIHAGPLQRLAGAVARAHRLKQLSIGPYLRVTIHTGACRRNSGETGNFDRGVAIAAIDSQSGDVVLMAERHGLRLANAFVGDVWRALNLHRDPAERSQYKDRTEDGDARQSIRAAVKDLRHALRMSQKTREDRWALPEFALKALEKLLT